MSRYWSETVKSIEPYIPGEQPGDKRYIKLNTNENPYPPSPRVIEAIKRTVNFVQECPNLLVMQTFSKSRSLAGLRTGFALGHEDLIEGLNRVKSSINSYTLDRIALAGAVEAMKDETYFQETRSKIINTRERVSTRLTEIGFKVIPSKANFVFISYPQFLGGELFQQLKERGILVRYFNKPKIDNFLRVTIGTDEEMDCFLNIIKDITMAL